MTLGIGPEPLPGAFDGLVEAGGIEGPQFGPVVETCLPPATPDVAAVVEDRVVQIEKHGFGQDVGHSMALVGVVGGGGRIRTHGALQHSGFQDRRLKPLGHPSALRCSTLARVRSRYRPRSYTNRWRGRSSPSSRVASSVGGQGPKLSSGDAHRRVAGGVTLAGGLVGGWQ